MKIKSSNSIRGVTLVEIAIVLVIIGLLLGRNPQRAGAH